MADSNQRKIQRSSLDDPLKGLSHLRNLQRNGELGHLVAFPFRHAKPGPSGFIPNQWSLLYPTPYHIGMEYEDVKDIIHDWCVDPSLVPQWFIERFGFVDPTSLTSLYYLEPGVGMPHMQDPIPGQRPGESRFDALVRETDPSPSLSDMCRITARLDVSHILVLSKDILEFIYPLLRYQWMHLVEALSGNQANEMLLLDDSGWSGIYETLMEYALLEIVEQGTVYLGGPLRVTST